MLFFAFLLFFTGNCLFCAEIDIGTQRFKPNDIVNQGEIQEKWSAGALSPVSFAHPQSEFYIYVKGLDLLGPTYEISRFVSSDEKNIAEDKWLMKSIEIDEIADEVFKEVRAFKIVQECMKREGGTVLDLYLTFKASTCDPLTIHWKKECGEPDLPRKSFNVGLSPLVADVVEAGVTTKLFEVSTENTGFEVLSEKESTTFYIYHASPNETTYLNAPVIVTDQEVLSVFLTGTASKAGYLTDEVLTLTLNYVCLVHDGIREEIFMYFQLPYYKSLEIRFFKVCGEVKENFTSFSKFLIIFLAVGIVLTGICMYCKYIRGDFDTEYLKKEAKNFVQNIKEKIWKREGKNEFELKDRELPDMFEEISLDGPNDEKIHTVYGTI